MKTRATRIAATVLVTAMMVGAIAATAYGQSSSDSAEKVVFTYGTPNDIDSFNPLVAVEAPAYTSFALQYNLLLDFSTEDLSPIPAIATEVPTEENGGISADGLTWTFKIREGMAWSDGQPLTSADVAFTYNYILDNAFGCCKSYLKFVTSVTAPDPTTLVIETEQPAVGLLSIYNYILPEHIWSEIDKEEAKTFENYDPATNTPVTSGPFHLVNWDKGQSWTFEANPDYWAGAPHIDEIVFRVYQNQDAVVAALRTGEIDFADSLQANLFNSLAESARHRDAQRRRIRLHLGRDQHGCHRHDPRLRRQPGPDGRERPPGPGDGRRTSRSWWTRCSWDTGRWGARSSRRRRRRSIWNPGGRT